MMRRRERGVCGWRAVMDDEEERAVCGMVCYDG